MGWTKRQFIVQAWEEAGYASYIYDLQPEQLESGLRRLDSMMATWNGRGIRIGYPIPSSPELSDLDEESNVPDSANEAIYTNLAIRLAPTVGKAISIETRKAAKEAYIELLSRHTKPNEQQLPSTMPLGAGNKTQRTGQTFVTPPDSPLSAGDDGTITLE